MNPSHLLLLAVFALPASALATGTGPTHPEKTREHPLDNREPRQEIIERPAEDEVIPPTRMDDSRRPPSERQSPPAGARDIEPPRSGSATGERP